MARTGSVVVLRMLNGAEQDIVRRCLVAMLDGEFIGDWEFQTRLGLSRDALRAILNRPELDYNSEEEDVQLAINNCMNGCSTVLGFPPPSGTNGFPCQSKRSNARS
jgi:hypothetical protein